MLPLANTIRRARDLRSLSVDLEMALESLDALEALWETPTAHDDFMLKTTESALLNNALVLYVRATKTKSKHRGDFDLRSRFSEEEKLTHDELVALRDDAIAHFGPGGRLGTEWHAELVILQVKGEDAKPAVATRRKMFDRNLTERARNQIGVALELLHVLTQGKLDEVADEINNAVANDPDFHNVVNRHRLNLDIFLTSDEAGAAARSSFGQGYAKWSLTR